MLMDIILELLRPRASRSIANEGSSSGMQAVGLAMFIFGGLAMLVAILAVYHP